MMTRLGSSRDGAAMLLGLELGRACALQAGEGQCVAVGQCRQRRDDLQPGGDVDQRVERVVGHGTPSSAVPHARQFARAAMMPAQARPATISGTVTGYSP